MCIFRNLSAVQVLGSPVLGDIQLSLVDKRGNLEVEVIRARGLQSKPGSKILPAPWVKVHNSPLCRQIAYTPVLQVYLVSGKKCLAKAKTSAARRTLDPLFQQQLIFHQRYGGCVLQVREHGITQEMAVTRPDRLRSGATTGGWRGQRCSWAWHKFCWTTLTSPTS